MKATNTISVAGHTWDGVYFSRGEINIEHYDISNDMDNITPLDIIDKVEDTSTQSEHILIGNFALFFRNDGHPMNFAFLISLDDFTARAPINISKYKMVTIIAQQLHYYLSDFLQSFSPTDTKGEPFKLLEFLLSEAYFEEKMNL